MQRLKKFNTININKKTIIMIVGIFAVLISLVIGASYAEYKQEAEVTFINARVADFRVFLTDITATSTNNSINLNYTASGLNAEAWCVFKTNSEGEYNIGASTTNNNNCTRTDLTPNTTYYYKVCSRNNLKQVAWECKEGSIATKYNPPTLSDITATSTTNSIKLTYTTSGYVKDYLCKWGTSASNRSNIAGMSLTECNITGLQPGTTYYYEVNVSNNGGGTSKTGSIATKVNPPTVTNISASATEDSIILSYSITGENITEYICKYGTTTNYGSTATASSTGCTITGLNSSTTYYYQICGTNVSGQTCISGEETTTTTCSKWQTFTYSSMRACESMCSSVCRYQGPQNYTCYECVG